MDSIPGIPKAKNPRQIAQAIPCAMNWRRADRAREPLLRAPASTSSSFDISVLGHWTRPSASVTQSYSPIRDDRTDESPRSGANCRSQLEANGPGDPQMVHACQASLHDEINNVVKSDDVYRANDASEQQRHHKAPGQSRPMADQQN
jgi:hypothetical protein